MTHEGAEASDFSRAEQERRLSALESELRAMRADIEELRQVVRGAQAHAAGDSPAAARGTEPASHASDSPLVAALRGKPGRASIPGIQGPSITGDQLESLVGRYGTLVSGALVILLGVGTLIVWAVKSGLLTPEVRVALGALAAIGVGVAGLHFRRKGELRYGNVLLALALAIVDVVAWGAGPQLHIVPTGVALLVVDLVAIVLAALALHDESEFLFGVAIAGALSAPFVTADRSGSAVVLLAYGAGVLIGALRSAREPTWLRAMALLVAGAAIYVLAAAALPFGQGWYGPFLIPLFGAVLAASSLLLAQREWSGMLARAYLAVALLGVMIGWDAVAAQSLAVSTIVSVGIAVVTYAALWVKDPEQPWWTASALVLPMLSVGIASAAALDARREGMVLALWGVFALVAWRAERARGEASRSGAHLLAGGVLVGAGILSELFWSSPLGVVAGLSGWGVVFALLSRDEDSPLPLIGVGLVLGASALLALEQLESLRPYAYTPFMTRPSASALCAAMGLAMSAAVLADGRGIAKSIANRAVRLGSVIGFVFLWGRMELVHAFSLDAATFLLTLYYAAVGVGSIVAGRRLGLAALRIGGLALAIYAAAKAVIEATAISGLLLRVGCYAAVGVFLLSAGYLYRNATPAITGADSGGEAEPAGSGG